MVYSSELMIDMSCRRRSIKQRIIYRRQRPMQCKCTTSNITYWRRPSVGKGVIGGGFGGREAPGVGANVSNCADTIAMEAEPISRIESFIFD